TQPIGEIGERPVDNPIGSPCRLGMSVVKEHSFARAVRQRRIRSAPRLAWLCFAWIWLPFSIRQLNCGHALKSSKVVLRRKSTRYIYAVPEQSRIALQPELVSEAGGDLHINQLGGTALSRTIGNQKIVVIRERTLELSCQRAGSMSNNIAGDLHGFPVISFSNRVSYSKRHSCCLNISASSVCRIPRACLLAGLKQNFLCVFLCACSCKRS